MYQHRVDQSDLLLPPNDLPLRDRVALVTGGSRGIGAAIVRKLATSGASVTFTYSSSQQPAVNLATELHDAGHNVKAIHVDARSTDEIRMAVAGVAGHEGRIDILVNNAGLAKSAVIEDCDLDLFDEMIAINVRAPFLCIREVLPHMPPGGRIVNIGSVSSDFMPYMGQSMYVMTKAAVQGLSRGLARELAARDITINTVQPGRVDTSLLRQVLGSEFDNIRQTAPMGRFGEPEEVADLVEFLCTAKASYINGAALRVDGGFSA